MAAINACLYLDQLRLSSYWPESADLEYNEFITRYRAGETSLEDCHFLTSRQVRAFKLALEADKYLPKVPSIDVPRAIATDIIALNDPDENSLVIVTSNNTFTFDVLISVWSQGVTPAFLARVDCQGNTVDMAMVFEKFTPEALEESLKQIDLDGNLSHRTAIVPGLAAPLAKEFEQVTGWNIEVGPVCAAEIPLFLGERWILPETV